MCTIGSVLLPERVITFKQCDLAAPTVFLEPRVRAGRGGLRYLSFEREERPGPWAAVNELGVAFVAADAYLAPEAMSALGPMGDVFEGYAAIVAEHESAREALDAMIDFYGGEGAPDILLISDLESAFLLEWSPEHGARVERRETGYLAATNHYRMLPGAVSEEDDPSTHLRFARAEAILEAETSLEGVHAVLADQRYGPTELSICRVARAPGEYHTQASVIFRAERGRVDCSYVINGSPRTAPFVEREDVFGDG